MHAIGVGFFIGAGIPQICGCGHSRQPDHDADGCRALGCDCDAYHVERSNTFVECGCCGAWHRADFDGDCREDNERHYDIPDDAEVIYLDDERSECDECGHLCKEDDETHYPGCSRIEVE